MILTNMNGVRWRSYTLADLLEEYEYDALNTLIFRDGLGMGPFCIIMPFKRSDDDRKTLACFDLSNNKVYHMALDAPVSLQDYRFEYHTKGYEVK